MIAFSIGVAVFLIGLLTCSLGMFTVNRFWHFFCGLFVWVGLLIIALSSFFILVYGA